MKNESNKLQNNAKKRAKPKKPTTKKRRSKQNNKQSFTPILPTKIYSKKQIDKHIQEIEDTHRLDMILILDDIKQINDKIETLKLEVVSQWKNISKIRADSYNYATQLHNKITDALKKDRQSIEPKDYSYSSY